jgi:carboxyl-terminal processing protease
MTQAQSELENGTTPLTLTISRPGSPQTHTVTVSPTAQTTVTAVTDRMMAGSIGYIRINQFTDGATAQFTSALTSLNPTTLKGLILDLRNCPGGLLDVGQSIAGMLTTQPNMGYLDTKGHQRVPLTIQSAKAVACTVVVLVNGGTANTAELLAATLQAGGDKVIGRETFGDAGDVRPVSLRDGSGFTMTVGQLLTPQGQSFAGRGIKPDIFVKNDSENLDTPITRPVDEDSDMSITRALDMLSGQVALR